MRKKKKMRKKNNLKVVSIKDYKKLTGVHLTLKHTGKMNGINSVSTSCLKNPRCVARMLKGGDGCICSHCYACAMSKQYSNLDKVLAKNTEILTSGILDTVPLITNKYFRFEAFGDLVNDVQFINYLNIAKMNRDTNFTIWTKNPDIIDNVFKQGYTRPKNLRIILSSPVINVLTDYVKIYSWCDSVFTVYTKEYASTHNIVINCGGRSCATCTGGRCYFKGGCHPVYINELLK